MLHPVAQNAQTDVSSLEKESCLLFAELIYSWAETLGGECDRQSVHRLAVTYTGGYLKTEAVGLHQQASISDIVCCWSSELNTSLAVKSRHGGRLCKSCSRGIQRTSDRKLPSYCIIVYIVYAVRCIIVTNAWAARSAIIMVCFFLYSRAWQLVGIRHGTMIMAVTIFHFISCGCVIVISQSIKVPYPSFERGRPYKRIFDMLTCLVPSRLGPVSICLTILLGRPSIVCAPALSSEAGHHT